MDTRSTIVIGAVVAALAVSGIAYWVSLPSKPAETYTVLHVCDAPFMRQSRGDAIVKRDSDGQVFVRTANALAKADSSAKFKDLCP